MIRNPIIHKEVLSALRTRKAIAMQGLFLLVTGILVLVLWPQGGLQDVGGEQARNILGILGIGELVMVVLFAPAFTAASITSEKERNSFESLFATSLRPWEIAVGKMVGSLAFLILVVLSGTVALSMPFLLGGVTGTQVLAVLGVLLLTALYLGMIGLLVSVVMHRSYRAIIVTYGVLLVVCFLVALPAWPVSNYLIRRGGPIWQGVLHTIASLSPLQAMLSVTWPESAVVKYSTGPEAMPPFWEIFILLSCFVIVITTIACLIKLRRPVPPPRPREKLRVVERGKISARTFMFIVDPRKRKRMVRWWQNPILIKEFRTRPTLQGQWLLRTVAIALIAAILLMGLVTVSVTAFAAESAGLVPTMAIAVAALITVLLLLIGPAFTSGTICADRETGVWDLIRMTEIPSWRIVSGKFQASLIPLLLLVVAIIPAFAILLYFNKGLWNSMLRTLQVVGMTVLFVSVAGMFFSSIFSKTSTATAWTYTVVISMGLLSMLMMLGQERFSDRLVSAVLVLNPVAAAMAAAGHHSMQELGLVSPHLKIMGAAAAVMFVITVVRVFQLRQADA
jgi:ABC-type transport system involved in multi-copper enzyme maturation permease subunit